MQKQIYFLELRKKFNLSDINYLALDEFIKNTSLKSVSLASTIQYLNLLPIIKNYFKKKSIKVYIKKGPIYLGQVLGCNASAFNMKADKLLLLADGKFHALNNSKILNKEIYVFNTQNIELFSLEDLKKLNQHTRAKQKIFLSSKKIGFLISTKPGQKIKSLDIIKKISNLNKSVYIFEADNLQLNELENFNLPIYVNSACPGISHDHNKVINLKDILEFV